MRIFKFGGASVNTAEGVKNCAHVLNTQGTDDLLVVVSAMGKMTNAFEVLVNAISRNAYEEKDLNGIVEYHTQIMDSLFDAEHEVHEKVASLITQLKDFIAANTSSDYDYLYDQVVCFGELISTTIVSSYCTTIGITNTWVDVREYIRTDAHHRNAKVDWEVTQQQIKNQLPKEHLVITQGFLGGTSANKTTTLGREGSDYTAGIFAYCLGAESVTIWKDVPGVLNADPRRFEHTTLLTQISYEEAIEMAFYGASVIHPKTIKPLQNKEIPLYVKSFIAPENTGTVVLKGESIVPKTPCYIVKNNQILLSIAALDFSFMVESNLSHIFKKLADYQLKVNLIQNSAISFSVCVEDTFSQIDAFLKEIEKHYKIAVYKDVVLYTVRHFDEKAKELIHQKGIAILTQINKETFQAVVR